MFSLSCVLQHASWLMYLLFWMSIYLFLKETTTLLEAVLALMSPGLLIMQLSGVAPYTHRVKKKHLASVLSCSESWRLQDTLCLGSMRRPGPSCRQELNFSTWYFSAVRCIRSAWRMPLKPKEHQSEMSFHSFC